MRLTGDGFGKSSLRFTIVVEKYTEGGIIADNHDFI